MTSVVVNVLLPKEWMVPLLQRGCESMAPKRSLKRGSKTRTSIIRFVRNRRLRLERPDTLLVRDSMCVKGKIRPVALIPILRFATVT